MTDEELLQQAAELGFQAKAFREHPIYAHAMQQLAINIMANMIEDSADDDIVLDLAKHMRVLRSVDGMLEQIEHDGQIAEHTLKDIRDERKYDS